MIDVFTFPINSLGIIVASGSLPLHAVIMLTTFLLHLVFMFVRTGGLSVGHHALPLWAQDKTGQCFLHKPEGLAFHTSR